MIKEPVAGRTVSMNALVLTGQGFTVHVLLEIAAVHELCPHASFSTDWA